MCQGGEIDCRSERREQGVELVLFEPTHHNGQIEYYASRLLTLSYYNLFSNASFPIDNATTTIMTNHMRCCMELQVIFFASIGAHTTLRWLTTSNVVFIDSVLFSFYSIFFGDADKIMGATSDFHEVGKPTGNSVRRLVHYVSRSSATIYDKKSESESKKMWKRMRRMKKNESEVRFLDEHKLFKNKKKYRTNATG